MHSSPGFLSVAPRTTHTLRCSLRLSSQAADPENESCAEWHAGNDYTGYRLEEKSNLEMNINEEGLKFFKLRLLIRFFGVVGRNLR